MGIEQSLLTKAALSAAETSAEQGQYRVTIAAALADAGIPVGFSFLSDDPAGGNGTDLWVYSKDSSSAYTSLRRARKGSDLGNDYTDNAMSLPVSTAGVAALGQKPDTPELDRVRFISVAAMLASTYPSRGAGAIWRAGQFTYVELSVPETGEHLTTAAGVRLYIAPGQPISPEALGATPAVITDGTVANDTAYMQLALDIGEDTARPVAFLSAAYRTTATLSVRCRTLTAINSTITKDIDNTAVVRFFGRLHSEGVFESLVGRLVVQQSAMPAANVAGVRQNPNANGFEFSGVVHGVFGKLIAYNCAYGFRTYDNPTLGYEARCWGNHFLYLEARGCRQGFLRLGFGGAGANTENRFGAVYFNGKERDNPTLVPMESAPILFDNAEGMSFGTLNFEWCSLVTSLQVRFIEVRNATNIKIDHFHPEGIYVTSGTNPALFYFSNSGGDVQGYVLIGTWHFNNWTVTGVNFHLVEAIAAALGKIEVAAVSGNPSSNVFTSTDLRLINHSGEFAAVFGERSGLNNVLTFTALRRGTYPSSNRPNIVFGRDAYSGDHTVALDGSTGTITVGLGEYLRLTGTLPAAFTTLSVTQRYASERTRKITVLNNSGSSGAFNTSGNFQVQGTSPMSWLNNRPAVIEYDFTLNRALIIGD